LKKCTCRMVGFKILMRGKGCLMNPKQLKRSRGMSLIEVMTAIVVLTVVMVGSLVYRYYTTLDEKEAEEQTAAARIASMLCESWRGVKGAEDYDPVAHLSPELRIVLVTTTDINSVYSYSDVDDSGGHFNLLGRYAVTLEGQRYRAALAWKDVSTSLRALSVVVNRKYYNRMSSDGTYQHVQETNISGDTSLDSNIDRDRFKLTAYVATN